MALGAGSPKLAGAAPHPVAGEAPAWTTGSASGDGSPLPDRRLPAFLIPWRMDPKPALPDLLGGSGAFTRKHLIALGPQLEPPARAHDYRTAARQGDWEAAIELIEALPKPAQREPTTRFALAWAAQKTGQWSKGLRALRRLERHLPVLSAEIEKMRARFQLEVGPFNAAANYYSQQGSADGLVKAAQALLNGRRPRKAERLLRKALRKIGRRRRKGRSRVRRGEVEARALLARVAEARRDRRLARREWLWLATEAPHRPEAADAAERYQRWSGRPLTKEQRFRRAEVFSSKGLAEATDRELQALMTAPGQAPSQAAQDATRAWAYYRSRTRYHEAAELFRRAAQFTPSERLSLLYHAARALSRAQRDDLAIEALDELADEHPRTPFGQRSRFRVARLYHANGKWSRADRGYARYLREYPRGKFVKAARQGQAMTHLLLGKSLPAAAKAFEQAAQSERTEEQALLKHLRALALERSGSRSAPAAYRAVIEEHPLSFAAFVSAARLRRRSLSVPPPHGPGSHAVGHSEGGRPPVGARLPSRAQALADAGLYTAAEGALYDERSAVRRAHPRRGDEALCELYGELQRGRRALGLSNYALREAGFDRRRLPTPGLGWAFRCHYPEPYAELVRSAERRHAMPRSLIYAVMRQESAFNPEALSPVGARGLMQLMPQTAARAGLELEQRAAAAAPLLQLGDTNVLKNVELGAFYLSELLEMFEDLLPVVIASYNAGPIAASRWLDHWGHLPLDLWVANIPYAETRGYVLRVLRNWAAYRYLDGAPTLPALSLRIPPGLRASPDAY